MTMNNHPIFSQERDEWVASEAMVERASDLFSKTGSPLQWNEACIACSQLHCLQVKNFFLLQSKGVSVLLQHMPKDWQTRGFAPHS